MELRKNDIYKVKSTTIALILFIITPIFSPAQHSSTLRDIIIPYILFFMFAFISNIKFKFDSTHVYALLLWFSATISTITGGASLNRTFISYLIFVLFFIFVTGQKWNSRELRIMLKIYIYIAVVCSFSIILSFIFQVPYTWGRYSIDILGVHKNPNYVASFILTAYSILLYLLLHSRYKTIFKPFSIILYLVIMVMGLLSTGTRASFLTAVIIFVFQISALVFNNKNIKRSIKILLGLLVLSVILYGVFKNFIEDAPIVAITRVLDFDSYTDDTSRTQAWSIVFNKFLDNPILGVGIEGSNEYLQNFNVITHVHNIFLQLLVDQGILGFSIFILLITSKLRYIKSSDKIFIVSIGISLFFPLLFQNGLVAVAFWWPIIFYIILVNFSISSNYGIREIFEKENQNS